MSVKIMQRLRFTIVLTGVIGALFFMPEAEYARAFDFIGAAKDATAMGAAYMTNLSLHEMGHEVVADAVGAKSQKISFFTRKDGKFFAGLATFNSIPKESKLPYALGGERMEGFVFDYALQSYRDDPTAFNKALVFFSGMDFLANTLVATFIFPDHAMCDQNIIRTETGCSKELMLSMAIAKTFLNAYRLMNEDANFTTMIEVDKSTAIFEVRFEF